MNFKVIFNLDGCGVYYDPNDPIHLDALLAYSLAPMQRVQRSIDRGTNPDKIRLPLMCSRVGGYDVWHASALFPDGESIETMRNWRKKIRQEYLHLASGGSPNVKQGVYREYDIPLPLLLTRRMVAYASGGCSKVKKILKKNVKSLGKKRSQGFGKIVSIECEHIAEDFSLVADGVAMRWLPYEKGNRYVRPIPPYWNKIDRVNCCEVGELWNGEKIS